PHRRPAVHGAVLVGVELLLGVEGLAARAVPAFVLRGVEVAGGRDPRDQGLNTEAGAGPGRSDEFVVANLEDLVELPVALDDAVRERQRRDTLRGRGLLDVLA